MKLKKGAIVMKKTPIIFLVLNICSVIAEVLPYGAVCNFATPEETITKTYSYFSLVPYGYANFGPFITAMLTCILCVTAILIFTHVAEKTVKVSLIICTVALVTSLMPLMFGLSCYNYVSLAVSLLILAQLIVIIKIKKDVFTRET